MVIPTFKQLAAAQKWVHIFPGVGASIRRRIDMGVIWAVGVREVLIRRWPVRTDRVVMKIHMSGIAVL